eukprot:gene7020-8160_t
MLSALLDYYLKPSEASRSQIKAGAKIKFRKQEIEVTDTMVSFILDLSKLLDLDEMVTFTFITTYRLQVKPLNYDRSEFGELFTEYYQQRSCLLTIAASVIKKAADFDSRHYEMTEAFMRRERKGWTDKLLSFIQQSDLASFDIPQRLAKHVQMHREYTLYTLNEHIKVREALFLLYYTQPSLSFPQEFSSFLEKTKSPDIDTRAGQYPQYLLLNQEYRDMTNTIDYMTVISSFAAMCSTSITESPLTDETKRTLVNLSKTFDDKTKSMASLSQVDATIVFFALIESGHVSPAFLDTSILARCLHRNPMHYMVALVAGLKRRVSFNLYIDVIQQILTRFAAVYDLPSTDATVVDIVFILFCKCLKINGLAPLPNNDIYTYALSQQILESSFDKTARLLCALTPSNPSLVFQTLLNKHIDQYSHTCEGDELVRLSDALESIEQSGDIVTGISSAKIGLAKHYVYCGAFKTMKVVVPGRTVQLFYSLGDRVLDTITAYTRHPRPSPSLTASFHHCARLITRLVQADHAAAQYFYHVIRSNNLDDALITMIHDAYEEPERLADAIDLIASFASDFPLFVLQLLKTRGVWRAENGSSIGSLGSMYAADKAAKRLLATPSLVHLLSSLIEARDKPQDDDNDVAIVRFLGQVVADHWVLASASNAAKARELLRSIFLLFSRILSGARAPRPHISLEAANTLVSMIFTSGPIQTTIFGAMQVAPLQQRGPSTLHSARFFVAPQSGREEDARERDELTVAALSLLDSAILLLINGDTFSLTIQLANSILAPDHTLFSTLILLAVSDVPDAPSLAASVLCRLLEAMRINGIDVILSPIVPDDLVESLSWSLVDPIRPDERKHDIFSLIAELAITQHTLTSRILATRITTSPPAAPDVAGALLTALANRDSPAYVSAWETVDSLYENAVQYANVLSVFNTSSAFWDALCALHDLKREPSPALNRARANSLRILAHQTLLASNVTDSSDIVPDFSKRIKSTFCDGLVGFMATYLEIGLASSLSSETASIVATVADKAGIAVGQLATRILHNVTIYDIPEQLPEDLAEALTRANQRRLLVASQIELSTSFSHFIRVALLKSMTSILPMHEQDYLVKLLFLALDSGAMTELPRSYKDIPLSHNNNNNNNNKPSNDQFGAIESEADKYTGVRIALDALADHPREASRWLATLAELVSALCDRLDTCNVLSGSNVKAIISRLVEVLVLVLAHKERPSMQPTLYHLIVGTLIMLSSSQGPSDNLDIDLSNFSSIIGPLSRVAMDPRFASASGDNLPALRIIALAAIRELIANLLNAQPSRLPAGLIVYLVNTLKTSLTGTIDATLASSILSLLTALAAKPFLCEALLEANLIENVLSSRDLSILPHALHPYDDSRASSLPRKNVANGLWAKILMLVASMASCAADQGERMGDALLVFVAAHRDRLLFYMAPTSPAPQQYTQRWVKQTALITQILGQLCRHTRRFYLRMRLFHELQSICHITMHALASSMDVDNFVATNYSAMTTNEHQSLSSNAFVSSIETKRLHIANNILESLVHLHQFIGQCEAFEPSITTTTSRPSFATYLFINRLIASKIPTGSSQHQHKALLEQMAERTCLLIALLSVSYHIHDPTLIDNIHLIRSLRLPSTSQSSNNHRSPNQNTSLSASSSSNDLSTEGSRFFSFINTLLLPHLRKYLKFAPSPNWGQAHTRDLHIATNRIQSL